MKTPLLWLYAAVVLVGGAAGRILADAGGPMMEAMTLDRVLEESGALFLRYVRARRG